MFEVPESRFVLLAALGVTLPTNRSHIRDDGQRTQWRLALTATRVVVYNKAAWSQVEALYWTWVTYLIMVNMQCRYSVWSWFWVELVSMSSSVVYNFVYKAWDRVGVIGASDKICHEHGRIWSLRGLVGWARKHSKQCAIVFGAPKAGKASGFRRFQSESLWVLSSFNMEKLFSFHWFAGGHLHRDAIFKFWENF